MNGWRVGFWDVVDQCLRGIGKGAAWVLTAGHLGDDVNAAGYALIGGAVLCALFGAIVGYVLSHFAHGMYIAGVTAIGGLLGACAGVFFGSFVEAVDQEINQVLASLKSK